MKFNCPEHGPYEKRDVQVSFDAGAMFCPYIRHHGVASANESKEWTDQMGYFEMKMRGVARE